MSNLAFGLGPSPALPDHLAAVTTKLGLALDQEPAWVAFCAAWRRAERDRAAIAAIVARGAGLAAPSLAESLAAQARQLVVELDATRRLQAAAAALYRELSPRQRAHADRLLTPLCLGARRSASGRPPLAPPITRRQPLGEPAAKPVQRRTADDRGGQPAVLRIASLRAQRHRSAGTTRLGEE